MIIIILIIRFDFDDFNTFYLFLLISELNLAVAAHISDRITDEVIESLSRSYKTLVSLTLTPLSNILSYNVLSILKKKVII